MKCGKQIAENYRQQWEGSCLLCMISIGDSQITVSLYPEYQAPRRPGNQWFQNKSLGVTMLIKFCS